MKIFSFKIISKLLYKKIRTLRISLRLSSALMWLKNLKVSSYLFSKHLISEEKRYALLSILWKIQSTSEYIWLFFARPNFWPVLFINYKSLYFCSKDSRSDSRVRVEYHNWYCLIVFLALFSSAQRWRSVNDTFKCSFFLTIPQSITEIKKISVQLMSTIKKTIRSKKTLFRKQFCMN